MPVVPKDKQEFHKSRIREHMAVNHQLSLFELVDKLEAEGLHLDRDYLSKLLRCEGKRLLECRNSKAISRVMKWPGLTFHERTIIRY
jgi:hypothetical protein